MPLGKPVVHELYSQKAESSLLVATGANSGEAASRMLCRDVYPSTSSPATMMCSRYRNWSRTAVILSSMDECTTSTPARLSLSIYS